jgi:hypothetical protein
MAKWLGGKVQYKDPVGVAKSNVASSEQQGPVQL